MASLPENGPALKPGEPDGLGQNGSGAGIGEGFFRTDSGNAERFAADHGQDVRYCHPWRKWLVWDGRRWRIDDTAEVERRAKDTVRKMFHDASQVENDTGRKAIVDHARASEAAGRRGAMIRLAKSERPIPILPEALDSDPWVLNCLNGTLDLRTGKLREHRRTDFITKMAPVAYDPRAQAATWKQFLHRIFDGNGEMMIFIQRLLGYCLTGDTSEQILPIFYGSGANGKSTLIETILAMLGGDYGTKAPRDLLLAKRDAHPTELTILHGRRLAVCTETEDGRRLAEATIKELSGSDTITARRMCEDFWQFRPIHKCLLVTNHRPEVRGTDNAIWRRLLLVPFEVTIPPGERDKALPTTLGQELPGILAWCVRGCLSWQASKGLRPPPRVVQATSDYRAEEDALQGFLDERCVVDPSARAGTAELLGAYQLWAGSDKGMGLQRFGRALTERGFGKKTVHGKVYRTGVGLLSTNAA